ncbi:unnamed protein product [Effrenium voratum]|nr:unnamed protein product [Effrenium voratum]
MKPLEKCESFFSSKMAAFLSEPGSKHLVKEDEENFDPRAAARALAMESQAVPPKLPDVPEDPGGRPALKGSRMPAGVLSGTFSAPVGFAGNLTGSLQAPSAFHGSLRVPLTGSFVSPGQVYREATHPSEEEMRKRIQESVRHVINAEQVPHAKPAFPPASRLTRLFGRMSSDTALMCGEWRASATT